MRWPLLLLAALAIAAFASLGRWQLQRGAEKERMQEQVAHVLTTRDAQPLSTAVGAADAGYAWSAGSGQFLPSPVLMLDNQRRGSLVGIRVFGLFRTQAPEAVLVDLGWLPLPGSRELPSITLPRGELQVFGLLAPPPAAGIALGPAPPATGAGPWLLTRIDVAELQGALSMRLSPRILRLDPALPLGYARDLDVLPNTLPPERHRGYALQWFGLAAAVAVISLLLGFRRQSR